MKKYILGIATTAMLSSSLMAAPAEKHFGINFVGLTSVSSDYNSDYGVNFGINKLWNPLTSIPGFGVGAGFDIDFNTLGSGSTQSADSDFTYGGDMKALVGYDFSSLGASVNVKAGVGYDFTVITGESYMSGIIYTASVGYDFSKSYGIEAVYRTGTLDLGTGPAFDKKVYSLNFVCRH